jgi:hypothetical protein
MADMNREQIKRLFLAAIENVVSRLESNASSADYDKLIAREMKTKLVNVLWPDPTDRFEP